MSKFYIKKGDTLPVFEKILSGSDGLHFEELSSIESVDFIMTDLNGTEKVNSSATLDETTGEATYQWESGDTDTKGSYKAEFQATYSDGNIRTAPQKTYWYIEIVDDLGD